MKKITLTVALFLSICGPSPAQEKPNISVEDAIGIAKREVNGTVTKAEFEDGIYEIKIRTEKGEKIKFKIGPKDGKIIRKGKLLKEPLPGPEKGNN